MPERDNKFTLMLSDEEKRMLESLAETKGLTASDYLRTAIRENYIVGRYEQGERRIGRTPKRVKKLTD